MQGIGQFPSARPWSGLSSKFWKGSCYCVRVLYNVLSALIAILILPYRLQEKNVKEKQIQHWKAVIGLQDRLKKSQISVGYFV